MIIAINGRPCVSQPKQNFSWECWNKMRAMTLMDGQLNPLSHLNGIQQGEAKSRMWEHWTLQAVRIHPISDAGIKSFPYCIFQRNVFHSVGVINSKYTFESLNPCKIATIHYTILPPHATYLLLNSIHIIIKNYNP